MVQLCTASKIHDDIILIYTRAGLAGQDQDFDVVHLLCQSNT